MNRTIRKWVMMLLTTLLFFVLNIDVQAAEGQVRFGSGQYTTKQGETFPIGVYVESTVGIGSYSLTLYYDSSVLEFVSGATLAEAGILYLDGAGTENGYQHMLSFRAIQSGDASIFVAQASGIANNDAMEEITFGTLPAAPISVEAGMIDTHLRTLRIQGYEDVFLFDPEQLTYSFQVESAMDRLTVLAESVDPNAQVLISETGLVAGENQIQIRVLAEGSEERVYELVVTRLEEVVEEVLPEDNSEIPEETVEDLTEETEDPEEIETEKEQVIRAETELQNDVQISIFQKFKNMIKKWLLIEEDANVIVLSLILILLLASIFLHWMMKLLKNMQTVAKIKKRNKNALDEPIQLIDLDQVDLNEVEVLDEIKLTNISMRFRMANEEASSLKEYFIQLMKGKQQYRYLTALNNISLTVKKGDVVGIIGTNGSGKSTLLKIVSGALRPTSGSIEVDRTKVQLLTLGTGFDMELTARENVYLNGSVIGFKKEYIDEKYNEIVKFAELEGFMEEKMKNFSSGMVSRLGFSIATIRETPEILILDEVLAVGDLFFRKKSEERIKQMIHSGGTVLIVAHSMDTIMKTCNKAIWIEKGNLQMVGVPIDVCKAYSSMDIVNLCD